MELDLNFQVVETVIFELLVWTVTTFKISWNLSGTDLEIFLSGTKCEILSFKTHCIVQSIRGAIPPSLRKSVLEIYSFSNIFPLIWHSLPSFIQNYMIKMGLRDKINVLHDTLNCIKKISFSFLPPFFIVSVIMIRLSLLWFYIYLFIFTCNKIIFY